MGAERDEMGCWLRQRGHGEAAGQEVSGPADRQVAVCFVKDLVVEPGEHDVLLPG